MFFFKPTNHLFSHMDLGSDIGHTVCLVACQLVDFLVGVTQVRAPAFSFQLACQWCIMSHQCTDKRHNCSRSAKTYCPTLFLFVLFFNGFCCNLCVCACEAVSQKVCKWLGGKTKCALQNCAAWLCSFWPKFGELSPPLPPPLPISLSLICLFGFSTD